MQQSMMLIWSKYCYLLTVDKSLNVFQCLQLICLSFGIIFLFVDILDFEIFFTFVLLSYTSINYHWPTKTFFLL